MNKTLLSFRIPYYFLPPSDIKVKPMALEELKEQKVKSCLHFRAKILPSKICVRPASTELLEMFWFLTWISFSLKFFYQDIKSYFFVKKQRKRKEIITTTYILLTSIEERKFSSHIKNLIEKIVLLTNQTTLLIFCWKPTFGIISLKEFFLAGQWQDLISSFFQILTLSLKCCCLSWLKRSWLSSPTSRFVWSIRKTWNFLSSVMKRYSCSQDVILIFKICFIELEKHHNERTMIK